MKKRSHRAEKMARVYDDEILPLWSQRFGKMLLRGLDVPPKAMVLDYGCGTGYPSVEILKRMGDSGRLIAIDPVGALLDVARKKAGNLSGKRIFFRSDSLTSKLSFAEDVYDLVISNVALTLLEDPAAVIKEFARVTRPGGRVIVTLPLAGTFGEFYDIYREVLTKNDSHEVLERLEAHIARSPDADEVGGWFEDAGLTSLDTDVEDFTLLFKTSREFFFAPVIEFGPLSQWKSVAGKGQEMQEIFWHIKESIDAYFGSRAFEVTIRAGCFRAVKPEPSDDLEPELPEEEPEEEAKPHGEEITAEVREEDVMAELEEDEESGIKRIKNDFHLDEDTNG